MAQSRNHACCIRKRGLSSPSMNTFSYSRWRCIDCCTLTFHVGVFALRDPVLQQLASFSGPKTGRAVLLDRSQAPPSSPSLLYRNAAWERGYVSLAGLPQQLHEQHALLSLLPWAYTAYVLFALLF